MNISVIICTYSLERLNDAMDTIRSVIMQSVMPTEIVIAVDHNDQVYNELESLIKQHGYVVGCESSTSKQPIIRMVRNVAEKGLSNNRNAGIEASTGDMIAFIDDDAIASETWLQELIEPFSKYSKVVAAGGKVVPYWMEGQRPNWFPEELDWIIGCTYKGFITTETIVRNVHGCNMIFDKDIFRHVGQFRNELGRIGKMQGVAEETELCLNIKCSIPDALIIYKPESIVHHKVPSWRVNAAYIVIRSYNEGYYKVLVQRLNPNYRKVLSAEREYLKHLFLNAVPYRLRYFYRKNSILQLGAIFLSTTSTLLGYSLGILHR